MSLTEFFMDLKRNVMSRETLDFNIEAKLIANDFQVTGTLHQDMKIIMRTEKHEILVWTQQLQFLDRAFAVQMSVSDVKLDMDIDADLLHDSFEFKLHLQSKKGTWRYGLGRLKAEMNQRVLDNVAEKVQGQLNTSKQTCMDKIGMWTEDMERHLQNMTNLNNTINERVRQDTNALSDLEKDFIKWQGEVHDTEHKLRNFKTKLTRLCLKYTVCTAW